MDFGRNDIKLFGYIFSDPGKFRPARADLLRFLYVFDDLYAGKVLGEGFAPGPLARVLGNDNGYFFLFLFDQRFRFIEQMELGAALSFIWSVFFTLRAENCLLEDTNLLLKNRYMLIFTSDDLILIKDDCLKFF